MEKIKKPESKACNLFARAIDNTLNFTLASTLALSILLSNKEMPVSGTPDPFEISNITKDLTNVTDSFYLFLGKKGNESTYKIVVNQSEGSPLPCVISIYSKGKNGTEVPSTREDLEYDLMLASPNVQVFKRRISTLKTILRDSCFLSENWIIEESNHNL
jgi:hypothetical protein